MSARIGITAQDWVAQSTVDPSVHDRRREELRNPVTDLHGLGQPAREQVTHVGPSVDSPVVARAWMSWSSGKDSALALAAARRSGTEVVRLLVTFNGDADRVAMHAVRRELVAAQAERLGIPV